MKTKKKLLLSLNKKKVSMLNTSFQHQIWGGTGPTYDCTNPNPTDAPCNSGYCQTHSCGSAGTC